MRQDGGVFKCCAVKINSWKNFNEKSSQTLQTQLKIKIGKKIEGGKKFIEIEKRAKKKISSKL